MRALRAEIVTTPPRWPRQRASAPHAAGHPRGQRRRHRGRTRARAHSPDAEVTLLVADHHPNFSICGIPYHVAGEVANWRDLAHRTRADLEAAGLTLRLGERALRIDPAAKSVHSVDETGRAHRHGYDRLVIATGARPQLPPISGLDQLGADDAVHVLHTMGDTFTLLDSLHKRAAHGAVIVGGGYLGLEMAEALRTRGLSVTLLERLPQLLATVDPQLADHVADALTRHGVDVHTGTTVTALTRDDANITAVDDQGRSWTADVLLVVTGVRPDTDLAAAAGIRLGAANAIAVDRQMRTNAPDIYAAGDCVHTYHQLLDRDTYLPLGTTAHKQGRVAGTNAAGGQASFAGSLGTQVVRVFDRVVAATGLRDQQAADAGFLPATVAAVADDHKAYYPGATPIHIHITGDTATGRLLGAQLLGHTGAEIAKRADIVATAISYHATVADLPDLDLTYTPPLGSPWDALQHAAHTWTTTVTTHAVASTATTRPFAP